ncbi:MAG: sigma-70 family RNA polymerase sigma factor [Phycisphaerales bacterium]|nr:sigma-70 family RNA polymerase sigma factor [Phycisphaerales bacterium]
MKLACSRTKAKSRPAPTLRKLRPSAKLPSEIVLRSLGDEAREMLTKRLSEPAECIFCPAFARVRSVEALETVIRVAGQRGKRPRVEASDGPTAIPTGADLLTSEQERQLFLTFNYCRYRVLRILDRFRGKRLDAAHTRALLHWESEAQQRRAAILRANTSLVLAMARRAKNTGVEISELVSEGNLALLRCVDKFDAARGFKFSTYACRAILASFSRAASKHARTRQVFPTSFEPAIERSDYLERKRERIEIECIDELRQILVENSAELSPVERRVLDARFSLDQAEDTAPIRRRTLDQIGVLLGVSKERVRQIQNQAINKLRAALEQRLPAAS